MNGKLGSAPSPTIGAVAATVSGSTAGTGTDRSSGANGAAGLSLGVPALWAATMLAGLLGAGALL